MPLDTKVNHSFSIWAATVGGILLVNGYTDFLANNHMRQSTDDPLKKGLGLVGAACPDKWLTTLDWARLVVQLGLVKTVIPKGDQENEEGMRRGIGVVFSAHKDESFAVETDSEKLILLLEKTRRRFENGESQTRYRFSVQSREPLTVDPD